jgi:hypothetical protein
VYEKKPRTDGFETVNQGRTGSSFSQLATTNDAELPETLMGVY